MKQMKSTARERTLVAALFILVLITFSLAQHDSKRLEHLYSLRIAKKANIAFDYKTAPVK